MRRRSLYLLFLGEYSTSESMPGVALIPNRRTRCICKRDGQWSVKDNAKGVSSNVSMHDQYINIQQPAWVMPSSVLLPRGSLALSCHKLVACLTTYYAPLESLRVSAPRKGQRSQIRRGTCSPRCTSRPEYWRRRRRRSRTRWYHQHNRDNCQI